jgi:hypothetical protein
VPALGLDVLHTLCHDSWMQEVRRADMPVLVVLLAGAVYGSIGTCGYSSASCGKPRVLQVAAGLWCLSRSGHLGQGTTHTLSSVIDHNAGVPELAVCKGAARPAVVRGVPGRSWGERVPHVDSLELPVGTALVDGHGLCLDGLCVGGQEPARVAITIQ